MLCAEQDLVRRDPKLPGLGLLLDEDRLRGWLSARGQELVRRRYLRYKPGTSCVLGLDLVAGPAFLITVSARARPKVDKTLRSAAAGTVLGLDHDGQTLLASFHADRDLPAVRDVASTLRGVLPRIDWAGVHVETLVHNPQRRWVALAQPRDDERVILRAQRPTVARLTAEKLRALGHAAVRVPALLGHSEPEGLVAVEHVPGVNLEQAVVDGSAGSFELAAAGQALARLHELSRLELPKRVRSTTHASAEQVGDLLPALRDRAMALSRRLASAPPVWDVAVPCHGDFSADQVVLGPTGEVTLIDWDAATMGDPATDLATAAAGSLDDEQVRALHEGYERVRPLPAGLDFRRAEALLCRAPEPFRSGDPNWPGAVDRLLTQAEGAWA